MNTVLPLDYFFYLMSGLSFLMSFAIGSNETDALSTTYSSGALTKIQCVRKSKY